MNNNSTPIRHAGTEAFRLAGDLLPFYPAPTLAEANETAAYNFQRLYDSGRLRLDQRPLFINQFVYTLRHGVNR